MQGSACSPELALALVQSVLVQLSGAPLLTALVVRATCKGRYNIYGLDAIARLTHLKVGPKQCAARSRRCNILWPLMCRCGQQRRQGVSAKVHMSRQPSC